MKTKSTKEHILGQGLNLLSLNGLEGVTLGVLAKQSGMSKSGLFAHFGSKEDVQLQLLTEMSRVATLTFVEAAMAQQAGLVRLRAMFEGWLGWSGKAGLSGGCPAAAAMFEVDDAELDNPVRERLLEMEKEWRALLAKLTKDAMDRGELRSDLDPEQFAWELCGIYLVHHTSYRLLRDPLATPRALTAFEGLTARSSMTRTAGKMGSRSSGKPG